MGARSLSRGAIVYGGRTATGALLSDLWVFDFSANAETCPWLPVSGAAQPGGVAGGAAVFDRDAGAVWLVGGFVGGVGGERTSSATWALSLADVHAGWTQAPDLSPAVVRVGEEGHPQCAAPHIAVCQVVEPKLDSVCDFPVAFDIQCSDRLPLPEPVYRDSDMEICGLSGCRDRSTSLV